MQRLLWHLLSLRPIQQISDQVESGGSLRSVVAEVRDSSIQYHRAFRAVRAACRCAFYSSRTIRYSVPTLQSLGKPLNNLLAVFSTAFFQPLNKKLQHPNSPKAYLIRAFVYYAFKDFAESLKAAQLNYTKAIWKNTANALEFLRVGVTALV